MNDQDRSLESPAMRNLNDAISALNHAEDEARRANHTWVAIVIEQACAKARRARAELLAAETKGG